MNNNGNYNNNQSWGTVTRVDNLGARKDSGTGALIGAAVGAIAGNQIGRTMNDAKTTGTVAGAVGGGLLGNAIERNQNKNNTVLPRLRAPGQRQRTFVGRDGSADDPQRRPARAHRERPAVRELIPPPGVVRPLPDERPRPARAWPREGQDAARLPDGPLSVRIGDFDPNRPTWQE